MVQFWLAKHIPKYLSGYITYNPVNKSLHSPAWQEEGTTDAFYRGILFKLITSF